MVPWTLTRVKYTQRRSKATEPPACTENIAKFADFLHIHIHRVDYDRCSTGPFDSMPARTSAPHQSQLSPHYPRDHHLTARISFLSLDAVGAQTTYLSTPPPRFISSKDFCSTTLTNFRPQLLSSSRIFLLQYQRKAKSICTPIVPSAAPPSPMGQKHVALVGV